MRQFEGCELKRCRLIHPEVTVGHLRGLRSAEDEGGEELLEAPVPLKAVRPVDYPRMRYLAVDGRCVYDWATAEQWSSYSAELDAQRDCLKACDPVAEMLSSAGEAEEREEEGTASEHEGTCEGRPTPGNVPYLQLAVARQPELLAHCFACLSLADVAHVAAASSGLRRAAQGSSELRRRLKEGRSATTAELARKKAADKRKKQRNAHIPSNDKVDGFARGGKGFG